MNKCVIHKKVLNKISISLFVLFLTGLLSGCPQQNTTYSEDEWSTTDSTNSQTSEHKSQAVIWGNESGQSLYLKPVDYAKQDPLGKQQQPQQRIERLAGKMLKIPSGSFQMGSNKSSDERPIHKVTISAFKLGQYEVTQQKWRAVMGNNPSRFKNCDNCPVEQVSWNDIQGFIKKLNQKTGQKFRLPSESEWEYACRSGGKNERYCGGNSVNSLAWYNSNSGSKTNAVGQKKPNGLGLYDMSGNVWEWTQDCWNGSYNGAPSNGSAWNSGNCKRRVLRGGSWYSSPFYLRSANRDGDTSSNRDFGSGFRLAQD